MSQLIVDKPIDAKTDEKICALPRDNFPASNGKWSILINPDHVFISAPKGETGFEIPRDQWDVICKWYMGVVP